MQTNFFEELKIILSQTTTDLVDSRQGRIVQGR